MGAIETAKAKEGKDETENKQIIQYFEIQAKAFFDKSNRIFGPAETISFVNLLLFLLGFMTIFIFIPIQFFNSAA